MKPSTEEVVEKYKDSLYRIAFQICRCSADADDAVQDCFIRYHTLGMEYESEEHLRAWLVRITINLSKNIVNSFWHRHRESWEETMNDLPFEQSEDRGLFDAVMTLPKKYALVIHLFYYEDYSVGEIASLLHSSPNTGKSQLSRGRKLLKDKWEEWNHDE